MAGDLSLSKGTEVEVLFIGKGGYWEGRAEGKQGWFPQDAIQAINKKAEEGAHSQTPPNHTVTTKTKGRRGSISKSGIRVAQLKKGPKGFGFSMRGVKAITGGPFRPSASVPALQYVAIVESESAAADAGLQPGDFIIEVNNHNTTFSTHSEVVDYIKNSDSSVLTLKLIRPSKLPPGIQGTQSFNGSPSAAVTNGSTSGNRQTVTPRAEPEFERSTHSPTLQRLSKESEWDSSEEDEAVEMEKKGGGHEACEPLRIESSPSLNPVQSTPPSKPTATAQFLDSGQLRNVKHPKPSSIQVEDSLKNASKPSASPQHLTTMASQLSALDKLPKFQDTRASEYDRVAQRMQSRKMNQPPPSKPPTSETPSDDEDSNMSAFGKALRRASLQRKERMRQNKPRITKPSNLLASPQTSNSNKTVPPTEDVDSPSTDRTFSPSPSLQTDTTDVNHIPKQPQSSQGTTETSPCQELSTPLPDSKSEEGEIAAKVELSGEAAVKMELEDRENERDTQESQESLRSRTHVICLSRGRQGFGFGVRRASGTAPESFQPLLSLPSLQYVSNVEKDSVADQGGLQVGDFLVEVDGADTTYSTREELVGFVTRCEEVLKLKVVRTSRHPPDMEELPQASLTEGEAGSTNHMSQPIEQPDGKVQIVSPLLQESRQPNQEVLPGAVATDMTMNKVLGDSPMGMKSKYAEEGQRGHLPLNTIATKPRELPAVGFDSDLRRALAESKMQKEGTKGSELDHFDILAQKMQSRKGQSLKSSGPEAHSSSNDGEASMSEFAKALRRASLQREARMSKNAPRLTKVVDLAVHPNSEDDSGSPSTQRVTSALLQKIESVATRINHSPTTPEHNRHSDTSGWSDADSPSPKMERTSEEDSEYKHETQESRLTDGGGHDEKQTYPASTDASTSEDIKKTLRIHIVNLKSNDNGYGFAMDEAESLGRRPFVPTPETPSPVFVSTVDSNGPASEAGITVGDYILKINDAIAAQVTLTEMKERVTGSRENLTLELARPLSLSDAHPTKSQNANTTGQLQQSKDEGSERGSESPSMAATGTVNDMTPRRYPPPPVKPKPSRARSQMSLPSFNSPTLSLDSNEKQDKQHKQKKACENQLAEPTQKVQRSIFKQQSLASTGTDRSSSSKPSPKMASPNSIDMSESMPVLRLKDKFENLAKQEQSPVFSRQVKTAVAKLQWRENKKNEAVESGSGGSTPTKTHHGKFPRSEQVPKNEPKSHLPSANEAPSDQVDASKVGFSSKGDETKTITSPCLSYPTESQDHIDRKEDKEETIPSSMAIDPQKDKKVNTWDSPSENGISVGSYNSLHQMITQVSEQFPSSPTSPERNEFPLPQSPSSESDSPLKETGVEDKFLPPPLPDHPNDNRMSYIDPFDFDLPPPLDFGAMEYPSESLDFADDIYPGLPPPLLESSPSSLQNGLSPSPLPESIPTAILQMEQHSSFTTNLEEGIIDEIPDDEGFRECDDYNGTPAAGLPPSAPVSDDKENGSMKVAIFNHPVEDTVDEPKVVPVDHDPIPTSEKEGDLLDSILDQLKALTGQESGQEESDDEPPPLPSCPPPDNLRSSFSTISLDLDVALEALDSSNTQLASCVEPPHTPAISERPQVELGAELHSSEVHFAASQKNQDLAHSPEDSEVPAALSSEDLETPVMDESMSVVKEEIIPPVSPDDNLDLLPPPMIEDDTEDELIPPFPVADGSLTSLNSDEQITCPFSPDDDLHLLPPPVIEPMEDEASPFSLPSPLLPDPLLDDEEITTPPNDSSTDQSLLPPPPLPISDESDVEQETVDNFDFLPPAPELPDMDVDQEEDPYIHLLPPPLLGKSAEEDDLHATEDLPADLPAPEELSTTTTSQLNYLESDDNPQVQDVIIPETCSKQEQTVAKACVSYREKPVKSWDTNDVCTWLSDIGLGAHCKVFAENEMMGEHLLDLSREELQDLGISKIGHQKTFRQKLELALNSLSDSQTQQ